MVGRQGMTLDAYRRLSMHDRYHLAKSVSAYHDMIYGSGAGQMNPEE
jgi:hypothetical protein